MLSLAIGHDVGYLTGPVAGGREGYYTGAVAAGEPAGLWYGAGAERLGLTGEVDAGLMEAVYTHLLDPRDPAAGSRSTWGEAAPLAAPHKKFRSPEQIYAELVAAEPQAGPERRTELRAQAEVSSRQAVSFIDATFSAPKSVTVLGVAFERAANDARAAGDERAAAAWAAHQRAVEDAVLAGARASLDYLQDAAGFARAGHHGGGGGRWVDAHEFVVAQFLQHDSRDRDPQLHVHNAILNRVQCADGTWRALDSRLLHAHRGAAGAIGERVTEAHLARTLGVEVATRPDGRAREIVGIDPELLALFSSRRHAITARTRELADAFTARFGREPSPLERTGWRSKPRWQPAQRNRTTGNRSTRDSTGGSGRRGRRSPAGWRASPPTRSPGSNTPATPTSGRCRMSSSVLSPTSAAPGPRGRGPISCERCPTSCPDTLAWSRVRSALYSNGSPTPHSRPQYRSRHPR